MKKKILLRKSVPRRKVLREGKYYAKKSIREVKYL